MQLSYGPWCAHAVPSLRPFPFQSVTLHTDLGDIKLELHCDLVPKTCEVSSLLSSSSGTWVRVRVRVRVRAVRMRHLSLCVKACIDYLLEFG